MNTSYEEFNGAVIRDGREALGWSLPELSTQLRMQEDHKVSAQTIGNYERGESSPTCKDLPKFARVLGKCLTDFYVVRKRAA